MIDRTKIDEILSRAEKLEGLCKEDVTYLLNSYSNKLKERIFYLAKEIKERIYGKRIVLFAPLYVSNYCQNECLYCGFHKNNKSLKRSRLTIESLKKEVEILINEGVKRILLVSSEDPSINVDKLCEFIESIYSLKNLKGSIRRVNINVAPLSVEEFRKLKLANIGTYQVFQETYNQSKYKIYHLSGPKSDFRYRYEAPFRALEAGIDDIGLGVLFGLDDPVMEIRGLLTHIDEMKKIYGVGPHTISIPRLKYAKGADLSYNPPYPIDDEFFCYIVAILRIAVPYTGIILSTREDRYLRDKLIELGVSQISAGSSTTPGGYLNKANEGEQFSTSDHRSLKEIVLNLVERGYIPSFCTACYRKGRTGEVFMELASDGRIRSFCDKNAILSFAEYMANFGEDRKGELKIKLEEILVNFSNDFLKEKIDKIFSGEKDIYI